MKNYYIYTIMVILSAFILFAFAGCGGGGGTVTQLHLLTITREVLWIPFRPLSRQTQEKVKELTQ